MTTDTDNLALIEALQTAYCAPENANFTNDAHKKFLAAQLLMPVHPQSRNEEPTPLFISENGLHFLPIFSTQEYLSNWAQDTLSDIGVMSLSGKDIVKGSGLNTIICLDIGQAHYKQFASDELKRLKMVITKLEKMLGTHNRSPN